MAFKRRTLNTREAFIKLDEENRNVRGRSIEPVERLMWAVVQQAIVDYIEIKKGKLPQSINHNTNEITKFFRSELFVEVCPNIEPDELIKRLNSDGERILKRIGNFKSFAPYKRKGE